MPQIASYTPSWLSHPAPGARIFSDPEQTSPPSPSKRRPAATSQHVPATVPTAPRQLIATRGSQVFTVVGNKIRWADLTKVKTAWESQAHKVEHPRNDEKIYRTLTTSIYYQITSISVSPSGYFLAIATEHAVWIAFLPDPARLQEHGTAIKLKTIQIGRTTHVIGEAALASVLWHPFATSSMSSDCLVTVTVDAAVRLWDFQRTDSLSFDKPALALDLERLANATSTKDDVEPKPFGRNRGFSVDAFDFEVAAACFGGRALENEDPWASMTLWIAMTNSDVYAVCPLLPAYWRPAPTTIPSLATTVTSEMIALSEEDSVDQKTAAQQRYSWVQELDQSETLPAQQDTGASVRRPSRPGCIPRLQGPFEVANVDIDNVDEAEISDLLVIPANMDEDNLFSGEEDYETVSGTKSLPFTVVCLTTTSNQLHIMLELDGVTAQWLPASEQASFSTPVGSAGEYVLLETMTVGPNAFDGAPKFSIDTTQLYVFFVTTNTHTYAVSLEHWATRVASEVSGDIADGLECRLKLACQGPLAHLQEILNFSNERSEGQVLSTAIMIQDAMLGTVILATKNGRAVAAQFDATLNTESHPTQQAHLSPSHTQSTFRTSQSFMKVLQEDSTRKVLPTRAPYAPSRSFYADQHATLAHIKSRIPAHKTTMLDETPLRLSPACLDVVTVAHRAFSQQTSAIEKAAAELFRRCLRLKEELVEQVKSMAELSVKIHDLYAHRDDDADADADAREDTSSLPQGRITAATAKQQDLIKRYEAIRRKAGQGLHKNRALSTAERVWAEDIKALAERVGDLPKESPHDGEAATLNDRAATLRQLQQELCATAKTLRIAQQGDQDPARTTPSSDRSSHSTLGPVTGLSKFQKAKIHEVMNMLERESAIIEAVETRLSRLKVAA